MRTRILNELKQAYKPYSGLWHEWTNYKYSNLNDEELYTMNIQIKNNFTVSIDEFVMFYNKIEIIEGLIIKLKFFFDEFKEWVILKWQISVLKLVPDSRGVNFLKTNISELDLSMELKEGLMRFGFGTLNDLFNTYTDGEFKSPILFNKVLETLTFLKKEELIVIY